MSAHGQLVMPKLGLTMEEGTIAKWQVGPGARFAAGDIIVVIETDKIANDVEAPAAGVMEEILFAEGAVVPVSEPIARWRLDEGGAAGARATALSPVAASAAPAVSPSVATRPATVVGSERGRPTSARVVSTPYARRLAREAGIDVAQVPGSGPGGRIKADDVLRAKAQAKPAAVTASRDLAATPAERPAFDVLSPADGHQAIAVRALSLAQVEISAHGLREIARRFPEAEAAAVRLALIAMASARAFPGSGGTVAVEVAAKTGGRTVPLPLDGRVTLRSLVATIFAAARTGADAPVALVSGGALLIIAGSAHASLFAPAAPVGWPAALGIGAERETLQRRPTGEIEGAHTIMLALSYDAAAITNGGALAFLSALKDLLEEPLVLLAG